MAGLNLSSVKGLTMLIFKFVHLLWVSPQKYLHV